MSTLQGMETSAADEEAQTTVPFINQGLAQWEKLRHEWQKKNASSEEKRPAAVNVDIDLVIDRIFSPDSTGELPHALPLPQVFASVPYTWQVLAVLL
mmetsp:Transcript_42094/g.71559  ORF Transcript_42094/g.71559 Transcript_42094/m.71559 type:complete len:97 (-) Transcript_42094:729-1019(-)